MPYIKQKRREALTDDFMMNAGELNYTLTMICKFYIDKHGLKYQHINDVLGALEGAKLEFYRRVAVPYENTKIAENGDVYCE